jgi:CheY-like chemotaxis protein
LVVKGNGPKTVRVLVTDDNRDSANSYAILLRLNGHEVCIAYPGQDALDISVKFRPQLLLLDLAMPGMDGYAVARQVRAYEWGSTLILVAVTGYGQATDRRKTQDGGFDHHFIKPVAFNLLQPLLQKCADAQA